MRETEVQRLLVAEYFASNAASFDLDPDSLKVQYVLNWGGFVNASYRIRDSKSAYHLKLSSSPEGREELRRWVALAPQLEQYHAPPVLAWIELGTAAGPLFPHLKGTPPSLNHDVLAAVVPMLQRLHADDRLAAALPKPDGLSARSAYLNSFHDRFTEDLRGIRDSPPPFVDEALVRWLDEETRAMSQLITTDPAFDEPLTKPVHGDLWLDNILWVDRDNWHVLDWDDLRIGDPAADIAALVGPNNTDTRPLKMVDQVTYALTATERARLQHLGRATLLDWVIDPLSDWIDAGAAPAHMQEVRAGKERIHKRALACYWELYA